tara:strand:+ start:414 stop:671 length:258 start_codon:yes stop_codon:yes gene_type:complete
LNGQWNALLNLCACIEAGERDRKQPLKYLSLGGGERIIHVDACPISHMETHNEVDAGQVRTLELPLAYLVEAAAMADPFRPTEVA